jgi:hypothetical protein
MHPEELNRTIGDSEWVFAGDRQSNLSANSGTSERCSSKRPALISAFTISRQPAPEASSAGSGLRTLLPSCLVTKECAAPLAFVPLLIAPTGSLRCGKLSTVGGVTSRSWFEGAHSGGTSRALFLHQRATICAAVVPTTS